MLKVLLQYEVRLPVHVVLSAALLEVLPNVRGRVPARHGHLAVADLLLLHRLLPVAALHCRGGLLGVGGQGSLGGGRGPPGRGLQGAGGGGRGGGGLHPALQHPGDRRGSGDGRVVVLQLLLHHQLPHRDGARRQDPDPLLLGILLLAVHLARLLPPEQLLLLRRDHLDLLLDGDELHSLDRRGAGAVALNTLRGAEDVPERYTGYNSQPPLELQTKVHPKMLSWEKSPNRI